MTGSNVPRSPSSSPAHLTVAMPGLGAGPAPHLLQPCPLWCPGAPLQLQDSVNLVAKLESEPRSVRAGAGCKVQGVSGRLSRPRPSCNRSAGCREDSGIRGHKTNWTCLLQSVCLLVPKWPEHQHPEGHLPLPTSSLQQHGKILPLTVQSALWPETELRPKTILNKQMGRPA